MLLTPAVNLGFSSAVLANAAGSVLHTLGGLDSLFQEAVTDPFTEIPPTAYRPFRSRNLSVTEGLALV